MKKLLLAVIPRPFISAYHFLLSFAGAAIYGFPSRRLTVIGVTGTNGKTTTVQLISHILEAAGRKVGHLSSVDFKIGDTRIQNDFKMTMPGRFFIQRMLRRMADDGCTHVVLEVTSEGILQHRQRFIDFDASVLTNVTPEHLERHGGFEAYRKAKEQLFAALRGKIGTALVVNLDDPNAEHFLRYNAGKKYGYRIKTQNGEHKTIEQPSRTVEAGRINASANGIDFTVDQTNFHLNLLGEFNVANALAAITTCVSQGVPMETIRDACASFQGVPGRMEIVVDKPFKVIVDYGHTPDALEKVYTTIKSAQPGTRLICVFGSTGGGRDKWKRPEMGKVAATHCDQIILTNDDPYDEDQEAIIEQIAKGCAQIRDTRYEIRKIIDRHKAIEKGLSLAQPGDTVIITGKGAEPILMGPNASKIPWDDRQIVRNTLSCYLEHYGNDEIRRP